jgi:hypothetical protein
MLWIPRMVFTVFKFKAQCNVVDLPNWYLQCQTLYTMYLYCRHAYLIFTLLNCLSQFTNIYYMCAELLFTVLKLCTMYLEEIEQRMNVVQFEVLSVVVHKITIM